MLSKNHPIILFIERNGFSLFQDTLPNIPKFNFTPDLVANLDVVNKEQFVNLLATFIQINKIVPSSLAVILSDNVIYVKDLTNPVEKPIPSQGLSVEPNADKEHKDEIQNFLENIPFEEILAKVIKTGEGGRIVAVNKDLVMTIADAFVNKGSIIEAIIPSFLYGPNVNFTLGLAQDNVSAILEGSEIVRVGNLLTDQQKMNSQQSLETETKEKEKKPQNLRQYILVGVFTALLVIFVVVFLNLGASQTPPGKNIKSSSVNTVSVPTTTPALTQAPITASVELKSIKIKIVQNPQSDTIVSNLKNELTKIGFEGIISETSGDTTAEKSSVLFSQNVPDKVRNSAIIEIKKVLPDISILEHQDSNLTITILIGKLQNEAKIAPVKPI